MRPFMRHRYAIRRLPLETILLCHRNDCRMAMEPSTVSAIAVGGCRHSHHHLVTHASLGCGHETTMAREQQQANRVRQTTKGR